MSPENLGLLFYTPKYAYRCFVVLLLVAKTQMQPVVDKKQL